MEPRVQTKEEERCIDHRLRRRREDPAPPTPAPPGETGNTPAAPAQGRAATERRDKADASADDTRKDGQKNHIDIKYVIKCQQV